ncbi:hypothetical protein [Lentzea albida]|nr:hypothetical protein [Lentzea albida]
MSFSPFAPRAHRPLAVLTATMAGLAVFSLVALLVDDRLLMGQPVWTKPLKFALSTLLYSVSVSWVLSRVTRFRRVADAAATVFVVSFLVELAWITWSAARGRMSHFGVATPLESVLYQVAGLIGVVVWIMSAIVCVALMLSATENRAQVWSMRAGMLIALAGMAVGALMTSPTPEQVAGPSDLRGAHSVGVADGGAALPLLGWSTEGGDLRIPHFIGMHALQVLPLVLAALRLAGRRLPALRRPEVEFQLVLITSAGYAALLGLLLWQALRGQSIVSPDGLTAGAGVAAVICLGAATAAVVLRAGRGTKAIPVG